MLKLIEWDVHGYDEKTHGIYPDLTSWTWHVWGDAALWRHAVVAGYDNTCNDLDRSASLIPPESQSTAATGACQGLVLPKR